ncbi:MAG: MMPL family transporter, partial [Candidatus Riflebacteria bacterium]
MKKLADFAYFLVSQRSIVVILVIFAAFFFSLTAFVNVETDDDLESGITSKEALASLAKLKAEFGDEQQILLAYPITGIDRASIIDLWQLVQKLKGLPHVRGVMSLLDVFQSFHRQQEFEDYLLDFRINNLKELVLNNLLFEKFMIGRDGCSLQLVIVPDLSFPDCQKQLYRQLNSILPAHFKERPFHLFGYMYFKERFFEFIERNNVVFVTSGFVLCSVLAWFFFPDLIVLILILCSVGIPTVLTFAIYFANGNKINIFTSPIIPFALIISLSEIIYLVSFFKRNHKNQHKSYDDLHRENFFKLLRPCLINSLTTLIGFLSLSYSPSPNIRLFSLYTSLACFLSYFITFGLIFSALKLYRPWFSREIAMSSRSGEGLRRFIRNLLFRKTVWVLALSVIVGMLALPLAGSFQQRNSLTDSFSLSDPIVKSWEFIEKNFSGPYQLLLLVGGPRPLERDFLLAIERLQHELLQEPEVNRVFSLVNLLKEFTRNFSDGPIIPDEKELILSILELYDARGIAEMVVSQNADQLLVRVSINVSDDFKIYDLGQKILGIARRSLPAGSNVEVSGEIYSHAVLQKNILENISGSFAGAILMISLVFLAVFRSFSLSFIALLVNFYPIFFAYAFAFWAGIPLNPSTAVAGCVMSGLIVDDTLHTITFFHDARQPTLTRRLLLTMQQMTWPVIYSSILLGLGNAIFIFSDFKPFAYFGGIGALIVLIGIIGDLLVLPACIIFYNRLKTGKK